MEENSRVPAFYPVPPVQAPDSSQPGFLAPVNEYGALDDLELRRFLQQWVAGVLGIDPRLVRPRWEQEPDNEPSFETTWAAVGPESGMPRKPDTFAFVGQFPDGNSGAIMHEVLDLMVSMYGPNCQRLATRFAMGVQLGQNRQALALKGFGFIAYEEQRVMPVHRGTRWLNGVDIPFSLRRRVQASYNVLPLLGAGVDLITDVPAATRVITVTPPED